MMLLVLRRRQSRRVMLVAALAFAFAPATGRAETHKMCEDLCLSIQLDGGPYKPAIDSEPGLTGSPYSAIFGTSAPWIARLTLGAGWNTGAGTFGLGVAGAYWSVDGKGRSQDARNVSTGDKVSLSLSSVTPLIFWRASFISDRWHVPVVPFGQVGYGFVSWLTQKNEHISSAAGTNGDGWGRGLEWSAGLMVPLDGIDEGGALNFYRSYGVSSTSLFVAYSNTQWRARDGLVLGSQGVTVGLTVMH
jgi:hypothetical protein